MPRQTSLHITTRHMIKAEQQAEIPRPASADITDGNTLDWIIVCFYSPFLTDTDSAIHH